ncbi:MAG: cyclase family protein [Rhizobacter sp.]|nr:cyclase family protein [Chlorobiales bacterium]
MRSTDNRRTIRIDNIVDLTHTLTSKFPFIPVKKLTYPFELIPMATLKDNGVEANSWKIHEHLGTHIDAPNHFIENQKSVDQIELKDLIVPVVVVDIEEKTSRNRDAELTVDDLLNFEKQYGEIPSRACVMMYSGWEKRLNDSSFVGLDDKQVKHFPGFSDEAIRFLLTRRNISGIGVDVLSFDPGVDENYTGHKILFAAGKWGVECVANLNKIPKTGATIIVGAPKVGKATGGFSRIIAVW